MSRVSKVKFKNNLKETILKAVELIGGFSKFINRGDVVFLKPNFNTADPFPASSDPEFLKQVVELTYDYGAKAIMIGDSSTYTLNTRKVMEKLKIFDFLNMERPPRIYVFEEGGWIKKGIPKAKYLKSVSLPRILDRADKLILLPCLKTHSQAQFTGSLKLSVGFVKPLERVRLHSYYLLKNFQRKIAELNKIINPNLIIMDGRKCFISRGPAEGEIREPNVILASTDRIAIDVEGIKIIQSFKGNSLRDLNPWEILQIKTAVEFNLGAKNEKDYQVLSEDTVEK